MMLGMKQALTVDEFTALLSATKLCTKPKIKKKKNGKDGKDGKDSSKDDGGSGNATDNSQQRDIKTIFLGELWLFFTNFLFFLVSNSYKKIFFQFLDG